MTEAFRPTFSGKLINYYQFITSRSFYLTFGRQSSPAPFHAWFCSPAGGYQPDSKPVGWREYSAPPQARPRIADFAPGHLILFIVFCI